MFVAAACPTCGSLRAAVLRLVADRGIDELSLSTLGRACGLTPGELADHYPRACDCLYDAYDDLTADLRRDASDAFESCATWPEALNAVWSRMLRRLAARPEEARLLFVEAMRGDRELRRRRELGRQRMIALLLAEHQRHGELEWISSVQLEMLLGASCHLIAARVAEGRTAELPELESELAELAEMFEPAAIAA